MEPGLTLGVSGWRLQGQRTGVGRYLQSLVEQWTPPLVSERFDRVTLYSPRSLEHARIDVPASVQVNVLDSALPMLAWDNIRVGPLAKESVVFYPSYSRPFVTRQATVVTTHDATLRILPEMFSRRDRLMYEWLYGWSARAATLVITTSQAAKRDIVRVWNVDPAKIRVTPLAAAPSFRPLPDREDRDKLRHELLGSGAPYFMFVGKISGRRNLPELLRAFTEFKRGGFPHRMLIVGPAYAIAAVNELSASTGLADDLVTRSFVTDEVLNQLYNCADAFVMPSVYENGSLPVFEAQATGTPVISVATEGTEEITGGSALLIPKLETSHLVEAMTRVASDETLRQDLSRRGLENSRRYSWERCARETLDVCTEAVGLHRN